MCASRNPPFVLNGIPLSGQPGHIQVCVALFGLAPLGSLVSFQYQYLQATSPHHHFSLAGCHFCFVASCLQLIITNSSACCEGGVSSLSSNPHAS